MSVLNCLRAIESFELIASAIFNGQQLPYAELNKNLGGRQ